MARYSEQGGLVATHQGHCSLDTFSKQQVPMHGGYRSLFGNKVHETAIVDWNNVEIGTGNVIGPYACLGGEAQHKNAFSAGKVIIGNNNTIREFATIHRSTDLNKGTVVGDDNYLMVGAHVAHDCSLEDGIVLCNNASIAGHVHVMQGAVLSLNCSVHQYQTIGAWSIIGMNSCVKKSEVVEPGYKFFGVPAKRICRNSVALKRNKVTQEQLSAELARFSVLRDRKHSS